VQIIRITKKGVAWFNTGHPWIYKDDCIDKKSEKQHHAIVEVFSETGKFLAKAFYNPHSQIALRIITKNEEDINRDFWRNQTACLALWRICTEML